ncbi:pitrilysin family protein [Rhodonellum sp.]|uniref:M16 family metallopeptidase n=1 Tax=Rhodonellum sp. TaxID=2231180 RepID=UPI00271F7E56|nr:pitrilysin family protein [Rhodonellum sp.]MDO9551940.1 pitrilysin family protein [Rhodonellum sp.]
MKKILLYFIMSLMIPAGMAQVDRSTYPEAGPAREIKLGDAESFTLKNGLKVFVVKNSKLPRVAFSLVLERDPIFEGNKAGMLGLVGEMMTAGTSNRTKDQLDQEIDFIGGSLSASANSIFASSLKKHQGKVLELMSDVLFNPIFPQEELDKLKKQSISGLATSKDDPNSISRRLSAALVYGKDHPYGESETEATINNITVEDIKGYYQTYYKPNIAYLAIVGDIDEKEARKLVEQYFSKWKKGEVPKKTYAKPALPEKNQVALVDRSASVQTVVNITYPMEMRLDNPEYLTTRVLNYILGGGSSSRLFLNLREDKGYTYGAYSSIGADKLVTSFSANASVKQTATDSSIHEMIYEIRNLADKGITQSELETAKANLSGSFGRSLESPSTIANFAINTERYKLPKDFYTTYLQRLNAITIEDVNAAAKKHLKPDNMYITVVGNGSEIKDKLTAFGEIKTFTNMGEPEKEMQMADAEMTASKVIDNYITAIGGEENLKKIKTAKIESSAEIQGMKLSFLFLYDEPKAAFNQKVMMMGNVASNTTIKDGKAVMSAGGQTQELTDEQFEAAKMGMFIFPELHFEDLGYNIELDGIKDVEGEEAYKVIVTNPTGSKQVNYYSVATGLKIKNENAEAGDSSFGSYEEIQGVKYPMETVIKSPMIPVPLESKVEKIEFNVAISGEEMN